MSGGGGKQPSTTTQRTEPPAYALPFLEQIAGQAQGLYEGPNQQYYPGSTVVGFSPQTLQALQMQEALATGGSPLVQQAQDTAMQTARGDFLDPGNEHFMAAMDASSRPLLERYSEVIAPTLSAQFAKAGRSGGNEANMTSQLRAASDLERNLGDQFATQAFSNYARERQNQLMAAGQLPGLEQAGYANAQRLAGIGQAYEGQDAAYLQEDIDRFQFGQQQPYDALAQYAAFINSTNPQAYPSQYARTSGGGGGGGGAMSGAMSGAALGSFFGPWGMGVGAVGGGLLGGFG